MRVRSMTKFLTCLQKMFVANHLLASIKTLVTFAYLTSKAKSPARLILVPIDHTKTGKASSGLEHGKGVWIANQLSIVVVDNGGGDEVGAGREVDNGRRCCRRSAFARGTSVAVANSSLYCCSIVCYTVSEGKVRCCYSTCAPPLTLSLHRTLHFGKRCKRCLD